MFDDRKAATEYLRSAAYPAARAVIDQYADAERAMLELMRTPSLDAQIKSSDETRALASKLREAIQAACKVAYGNRTDEQQSTDAAHMFLHRVLYRINRMGIFWFDDLSNYENERSPFLQNLRDEIEEVWQPWELQQLQLQEGSLEQYKGLSMDAIQQGLKDRYQRDVDPPHSAPLRYIRDSMSALGYAHLLAIGSLDGLVEASRQSKVCGGAANDVSCMVFRVLMEEYGGGRYTRKHSTFYKTMMQELGLETAEEHYLDLVPWQGLAVANHNFLLTERRRHYLRYCGGLSFFEINGPSIYKAYLGAAERLGLSDAASGYWELHIREDERHGRQMLEEVALPLTDMYPRNAWELLLGYDQEVAMGARAGKAIEAAIRAAEQHQ